MEIFDGEHQKDTLFYIDGEVHSWEALINDLDNPIDVATGLPLYKKDPKNPAYIATEDVPKTLMHKANQQWVAAINENGCTVIDLGYPPLDPLNNKEIPSSPYYNMELATIDF